MATFVFKSYAAILKSWPTHSRPDAAPILRLLCKAKKTWIKVRQQVQRCSIRRQQNGFFGRRPRSSALVRTAIIFSMAYSDLRLSALRLLDLYQLGTINF
jgi:ribosomal protein L15E